MIESDKEKDEEQIHKKSDQQQSIYDSCSNKSLS